jgi:hypothetical protein
MGRRWNDRFSDTRTPDEADTIVEGHVTHISEDAPQLLPPQPLPPLHPYPPGQRAYPPALYRGGYAPSPYARHEEPEPERGPSLLAQPLPGWLTVATPLVLLATLALAFVTEVYLLGSDWATGLIAASLAAFALAAVVVVMLIVRLIVGRRALGTAILAILLTLTLAGAGLAGFSQLNTLRVAQARQDENARHWHDAIQEYANAGQKAPNAPDIARVYTEWGEALAGDGDNAGAVSKLTTAAQTYVLSGAMVTRARADLYSTYVSWIQSGATAIPYQQALTFFASYAVDPACDASCQSAISAASARAHYQFGQQLASASQYKQAITEFELTQAQYAASPYAQQAHTAAATAYMAFAGQLVTQDCGSAVPLYQTLAKSYADTPEGKRATTTLAAPVKVSGRVKGAPGKPAVTMYLARRANAQSPQDLGKYHAALNSSTGVYSFSSVAPGVYYPTGFQTTSTQYIYSPWTVTNAQGKKSYYSVTIGPVCAYQIPDLNW